MELPNHSPSLPHIRQNNSWITFRGKASIICLKTMCNAGSFEGSVQLSREMKKYEGTAYTTQERTTVSNNKKCFSNNKIYLALTYFRE